MFLSEYVNSDGFGYLLQLIETLYFKYIINILYCKVFSFSDKYQMNYQSGHYYVRIDISAKTAFNCHHCIMCSGISHLGHVTEH